MKQIIIQYFLKVISIRDIETLTKYYIISWRNHDDDCLRAISSFSKILITILLQIHRVIIYDLNSSHIFRFIQKIFAEFKVVVFYMAQHNPLCGLIYYGAVQLHLHTQ